MSPAANAQNSNATDAAKRRRACDVCRRSKIRCNVAASDDTPCAHCSRFKLECTFLEDSKRRAPAKGYVICLENRCRQLELLIKRVAPYIDIDREVGPAFSQDTWSEVVFVNQPLPSDTSSSTPPHSIAGTSEKLSVSSPSSSHGPGIHIEEHIRDRLQKDLESLSLNKDVPSRFHGKSSGFHLLRVAMELKDSALGSAPGARTKSASPRPKFWAPPLWEATAAAQPPMTTIIWPPDDLLDLLVNLYFSENSQLFPILHRPSFERSLKAGLHKTDVDFAKLVLALCALASQFCDDPRVFLQDNHDDIDWSSAGWKYFSQLLTMHHALFKPCSLSGLQTFAMVCIYCQFCVAPQVAWLLSGIAVRFALDIGLHREKIYRGDQPLEDQLWKRTFWALVGLDIMMSSRLGRPTAVSLDDINAKLPLEVSDEFYNEATKQWNQPEGEPPRSGGSLQFIKLKMIVGRTLQTIYAVQDPSPGAVAELDNALSEWLDELPQHLRWDPTAHDTAYQKSSAILRLFFLHTQIVVHRRFLPAVLQAGYGGSPTLSASALAICTTAAQAIVRVLQTLEQIGRRGMPLAGFAFGAATILLLNIWDTQRKGPLDVDISGHMEDVQRCIRVLRASERRWRSAGRLVDILNELASMSEVPMREATRTTRQKRTRDDEDEDDESIPRAFRPEFSIISASDVPIHHSDDQSHISSTSGGANFGAVQWNADQSTAYMPTSGGNDFLGLAGGPSGYAASYPGVNFPSDAFQNLFGNMDDLYNNNDAHLPSTGPSGNDIFANNIDWATELSFLGMNQGIGEGTWPGPSSP